MSFFIIILLNSFFHPKQIRASILINVVLSFQHNQFSYTRQKHIQHTKQQQTNTDPQKVCMNICTFFVTSCTNIIMYAFAACVIYLSPALCMPCGACSPIKREKGCFPKSPNISGNAIYSGTGG